MSAIAIIIIATAFSSVSYGIFALDRVEWAVQSDRMRRPRAPRRPRIVARAIRLRGTYAVRARS